MTLVIAYFVLARVLLKRDLKVTATVEIPPFGSPLAIFVPSEAAAEDLTRMVLTYGSKLRWLLIHEPNEIQEIFKELTAEVSDFWAEGTGPLLPRLPTAARLLENTKDHPAAVKTGERFVVRYMRTSFRMRPNKSRVTNDLAQPGLAVNLAWHYLVLVGAVYDALTPDARAIAGRAFQLWWADAFEQDIDPSPNGLVSLVATADSAWEAGRA